jgi:pimeloyl-ACP methyl ester carboxylesterase
MDAANSAGHCFGVPDAVAHLCIERRFRMKFIGKLLLLLCVSVALAQAQTPRHAPDIPTFPRTPGGPQIPHVQLRSQAPRALAVPALKTPAGVTPAACPEPTASLCGYIPVPLDRKHPNGAQIQIYFELYPHTSGGPAESAILVNFGGPGLATAALERDFAQFLFAPNLDVHDLLLIDNRGTGLSTAIDCEELQHGTVGFAQSEIDCAAQLGAAASRYATGDVAEDVEAVRVVLGYDKVDYFGASNGGADATAYAARYGEHLRAVVLDAPFSTPGANELLRLHFRTHADPRMVRLDCLRSFLCSADQRDPDDTLEDLIEHIQRHPVEGDSHDASGNPVHVRVDEDALLNFVVTYPAGAFVNTGEILAAAKALKNGDPAPLLRLDAEGAFTLVGDSGDPTINSAGDFYANGCMDAIEPWDWSQPVSERMEQYDAAVEDLPLDYYAPFSKAAPTGILFSTLGRQCFWWQRPTPPSPIVPPHANFTHAPTLVLDGDLDNRVPYEETNEVAELFPNNTNIIVAEAGHETVGWTQCARNLVAQFIENLQPGDTSCASTPETVWPAVGRFPNLVEDARPAKIDSSGTNQIRHAERKTVSVALATAFDALQRSLIGSGSGVGLRGGTFQTVFSGATSFATTTLTNCSFATDLIVNGTLSWGYDNSIVADFTVSGPGTAGGSLHVTGFWENPGPVGNFSVTGTLGGKHVAVLVPEA